MMDSRVFDVYVASPSGAHHQDKRLFSCSQCPYRTDRRNNLKRHVVTMHETNGAHLECCGVQFANKAALRQHTVGCHRHGYGCLTCGRVFCRRALLRRHHSVHSGLKEFVCNLCDYATSHKSNLERHMKIHEGEKPSSDPSQQENDMETSDLKRTGSHPILAGLLKTPEIPTSSRSTPTGAFSPKQTSYLPPGFPSYHPYGLPDSDRCFSRPSTVAGSMNYTMDSILGTQTDESSCGGHTSSEESVCSSTSPVSSRRVASSASSHWSGGLIVNAPKSSQLPDGVAFYPSTAGLPYFNKEWYASYSSDSERSEKRIEVPDFGGYLRLDFSSINLNGRKSPAPENNQESYYVPKKLRMSKRYMEVQ